MSFGDPQVHIARDIGWAVSKTDNMNFAYHDGNAGVAQLVEQRFCKP